MASAMSATSFAQLSFNAAGAIEFLRDVAELVEPRRVFAEGRRQRCQSEIYRNVVLAERGRACGTGVDVSTRRRDGLVAARVRGRTGSRRIGLLAWSAFRGGPAAPPRPRRGYSEMAKTSLRRDGTRLARVLAFRSAWRFEVASRPRRGRDVALQRSRNRYIPSRASTFDCVSPLAGALKTLVVGAEAVSAVAPAVAAAAVARASAVMPREVVRRVMYYV